MPTQTRSQARSAQSADLVTSPREHHTPRRILCSRQANAGVVVDTGDGGPFSIAARGTVFSSGLTFSSCKDKRCMTCPTFVKSDTFKSHVTNQKHKVINHTGESLSCHSQNIIYSLTCMFCGIQYIGETIWLFHKRNNQHRTEPNEHFEFHQNTSCACSYSYQIIEKLHGNGYNIDGSINSDMSKIRKDKEDEWIKKMRVIFPYGLCEKARGKENDCSKTHEAVGKSYKGFPIPRKGIRPVRSRIRRNIRLSIISCDDFFLNIRRHFSKPSFQLFFSHPYHSRSNQKESPQGNSFPYFK